jgi:SAM-dependent methyltransferase
VELDVIRDRIASLSPWHYEFDLKGVKTPTEPHLRNRHPRRAAQIFGALSTLTGDLSGKRVLDLGSRQGFWALKAIEAGADFVYGVEGRQFHVDQANFVFEASDVDPSRYQFVVDNVFTHDMSTHGPFDVVLCLGLLYHVSKPVELFEIMSAQNTDILVVDTRVSIAPGSAFEIHSESIDDPDNAIDYELVMLPTRRAVLDVAKQFGYKAEILPLALDNFAGMGDYQAGKRATYVCAKQTSLHVLGAGPAELPLAGVRMEVDKGMDRIRARLRSRQMKGQTGHRFG